MTLSSYDMDNLGRPTLGNSGYVVETSGYRVRNLGAPIEHAILAGVWALPAHRCGRF